MKIFITGICGFVGSAVAHALLQTNGADQTQITGLDNLSRRGSERNWKALARCGVRLVHGDIRLASDLEEIGETDWIIDASANAEVLAGVDGRTSSRQLVQHNLFGSLNLLEVCKSRGAGFILLSTSRVYSIPQLASIPVEVRDDAFRCIASSDLPPGCSLDGINEAFSTEPPLSLYGATKLASEVMAAEYGQAFGFPVWINRCGVLAGAGQFGHATQGIFSFWIHSYARKRPLRYLGFDGSGCQVRDCLHPADLARLISQQMRTCAGTPRPRIVNVGGGASNAVSLRQLSNWCAHRFGPLEIASDPKPRAFDVPWMVLDSRKAEKAWNWRPQVSLSSILGEIADHADGNPDWLDVAAA